MTLRAGALAENVLPGSSALGGMSSYDNGFVINNIESGPAVSFKFKMRGLNTLNQVVIWVVSGSPDFTGALFTGGNTPLSNISQAARF